MNFGSSTPPPDPELEAEKAAAKNEKIDAIRGRVSGLTDALVRTYGARMALFGSGGTAAAPADPATPAKKALNPYSQSPVGLFYQVTNPRGR